MTKRVRLARDVQEAMARNAAGAGRNTALKKIADRYHLSTASGGQMQAKLVHVGPPTRHYW